MDDEYEVYTIGHSTLSYAHFVNILMHIGVNAVVDVRSAPYSRRYPHFNREILDRELNEDSINYLFLGNELGGRPKESRFFCEGVADYEKMASTPSFEAGLRQVVERKDTYRLALMCSEHNPLDCHRCLLVGRALAAKQMSVGHIYSNGRVRSQIEIEADLLKLAEQAKADMFVSTGERLANAYRARASRVAFSASGSGLESSSEQHRGQFERHYNRIHENRR